MLYHRHYQLCYLVTTTFSSTHQHKLRHLRIILIVLLSLTTYVLTSQNYLQEFRAQYYKLPTQVLLVFLVLGWALVLFMIRRDILSPIIMWLLAEVEI